MSLLWLLGNHTVMYACRMFQVLREYVCVCTVIWYGTLLKVYASRRSRAKQSDYPSPQVCMNAKMLLCDVAYGVIQVRIKCVTSIMLKQAWHGNCAIYCRMKSMNAMHLHYFLYIYISHYTRIGQVHVYVWNLSLVILCMRVKLQTCIFHQAVAQTVA